MATLETDLRAELAGLDSLDALLPLRPSRFRRAWRITWPKLAAIATALVVWQLIVLSGWRPTYLLPGPVAVAQAFGNDTNTLVASAGNTLWQVLQGYVLAAVLGTLLALAVTGSRPVRTAIGPLLTGFQAMPSVAWVPFAIVLFQLSDSAILFVTVAGTLPAVAIGAVAGIDNISPSLLRAGRTLGATGAGWYRHVVLPASLPGYVTGLKQGWAFAWRSVMAGELVANVAGHPTLGSSLLGYQDRSLAPDMVAVMVVILAIGLLLDTLVFSPLERTVLQRRGLIAA